MGADNKDGLWFPQPGWKLQHKVYHRLVAAITENRQGAATVGEIDDLSLISGIILCHNRPLYRFFAQLMILPDDSKAEPEGLGTLPVLLEALGKHICILGIEVDIQCAI